MTQSFNSVLRRLIAWLQRVEDLLLALLLTGMILLASAQILLRNLFDSGLVWADPVLRITVLWVAMFGAMVATRERNHIHIDLLSRYLPERGTRYSHLFTDLFSAVVCGLVAWHAARFVYFEWQDGVRLFASFPAWFAELVLPLGFAVMALRFLLRVASELSPRRTG